MLGLLVCKRMTAFCITCSVPKHGIRRVVAFYNSDQSKAVLVLWLYLYMFWYPIFVILHLRSPSLTHVGVHTVTLESEKFTGETPKWQYITRTRHI